MASAGDPSAADIFNNEDEDLLDEDDDEESSDHDEHDSSSSAPVRAPPLTPAPQVTVAVPVPGLPDPHHHHHQEIVVAAAKRPMPPDESRKLFQRLWTDEDEIELLQGFLDYTAHRSVPHGSSSQHHHDTTAFYDQIRSRFQLDFNKNQLVEKLRRLKKKYRNVVTKFGSGKDYAFKSPHDQATFEISSKIWGNPAAGGPSSGFPSAPAPVEEEDDEDLNNPNFADCQSPKLNGVGMNSKTPRSRKRSRGGGAVKLEEKQVLGSNSNVNSTQAVTQMAAPVMGMGITGSLSSVIEDTVKSCLSPIFKELLSNSMNSNPNPSGLFCGHGFGLAQSPIPLCFSGTMGGDKNASNRWRKQQILELEVFSKRLELVQDQIREKLQELRSMGN